MYLVGVEEQLPYDIQGLEGTLEISGLLYRRGTGAQSICKAALSDMADGI